MLNVGVLAQLDVAEKRLAELIEAKKKANAAYDSEFESYCHSADGSEAQERRREELLSRMREKAYAADGAVNDQQQLVDELKKQLEQ